MLLAAGSTCTAARPRGNGARPGGRYLAPPDTVSKNPLCTSPRINSVCCSFGEPDSATFMGRKGSSSSSASHRWRWGCRGGGERETGKWIFYCVMIHCVPGGPGAGWRSRISDF